MRAATAVVNPSGELCRAAPGGERIAVREVNDMAARTDMGKDQLHDRRLARRLPSAAAVNIEAARLASGKREDARIDEPVVEDDVGVLQDAQRLQGQKIGIAGTGAD